MLLEERCKKFDCCFDEHKQTATEVVHSTSPFTLFYMRQEREVHFRGRSVQWHAYLKSVRYDFSDLIDYNSAFILSLDTEPEDPDLFSISIISCCFKKF